MRHLNVILFIILTSIFSCNSNYSSKKTGYFNISLPSHQYAVFDTTYFPYSFEYPTYAKIVKDTSYFEGKPENDFWINLDFPTLNAKLFLSYKKIGGNAFFKSKQWDGKYKDSMGINKFDLLVNDAYKLTNKNDVIASSINDIPIFTPNGIAGVFFKVGGNAATAKQFFLSDTFHHFIRGALYFYTTPNEDSLKPVQDFLQVDIEHLINTFKWNNANR